MNFDFHSLPFSCNNFHFHSRCRTTSCKFPLSLGCHEKNEKSEFQFPVIILLVSLRQLNLCDVGTSTVTRIMTVMISMQCALLSLCLGTIQVVRVTVKNKLCLRGAKSLRADITLTMSPFFTSRVSFTVTRVHTKLHQFLIRQFTFSFCSDRQEKKLLHLLHLAYLARS